MVVREKAFGRCVIIDDDPDILLSARLLLRELFHDVATYQEPEQALATDVGPPADLYAVGVLAYEMFVGNVPYHDSDVPMAIMLQHLNEPVPPLGAKRPDLDPGVLVALAEHPVGDAGVDEQADAAGLEDSGADGLRDLGVRPVVDDHVVDPVAGEQVGQHQPGGSAADDADSGGAALSLRCRRRRHDAI